MIVATARLEIATDEGASLSDVTDDVNAFLRSSGIAKGLCVLSTASEGACLTLSAELDEDVDNLLRVVRTHLSAPSPDRGTVDESLGSIDRLDVDDSGYPSGGVVADSITVSVRDGGMNLGSWDAVVLLDSRGPRACAVDVTLMGA